MKHVARAVHDLRALEVVKKAIIAVAHRILPAVSHMVLNHEPYRELRPAEPEEQRKEQLVVRMQQRLERLGYKVSAVLMAAQAA